MTKSLSELKDDYIRTAAVLELRANWVLSEKNLTDDPEKKANLLKRYALLRADIRHCNEIAELLAGYCKNERSRNDNNTVEHAVINKKFNIIVFLMFIDDVCRKQRSSPVLATRAYKPKTSIILLLRLLKP